MSHGGVRAGVSSRWRRFMSSRAAGNLTRRGAGGVTFRSHHSAGRIASATSTQGAAKASWPRLTMAHAPGLVDNPTYNASSADSGGRSVLWPAKLQPAAPASAARPSRWSAIRAM